MRNLAVSFPCLSVMTSSHQTRLAVKNLVIFSASVKSSVGHSSSCLKSRTHRAPWHGLSTRSERFCVLHELRECQQHWSSPLLWGLFSSSFILLTSELPRVTVIWFLFFFFFFVLKDFDVDCYAQRRLSGGSHSYGGESPRLSPCSSIGKLSKSDEQLSSLDRDSGQCSRNTSCETLGKRGCWGPSLSFGGCCSWGAGVDVVNALCLQLSSRSCCKRFSAGLFCRRGKSPGECVSFAVGDCSQTQFSSQVECFLHFSPVCRSDSPGRLKQCYFYMLGKKTKNINMTQIMSAVVYLLSFRYLFASVKN